MLKKRKGLSPIAIVLIVAVFFVLTWYASYYMGREDKLVRDIKIARGEIAEETFNPPPEENSKGKKGKTAAVVPPGTQTMPAALEIIPSSGKEGKKFKKAVADALEVIYNADKKTYEFIRDNLTMIRLGTSTGLFKEGEQRVAEISDKNAYYTRTWLAGLLAHQAYHSWYDKKVNAKKTKKKGPPPAPGKEPKPKFEVNLLLSDVTSHESAFALEERCAKFQLQILRLVNAPKAEQNFVANREPRDFSYAHDGNFTITP